jgi:hypothetical protein
MIKKGDRSKANYWGNYTVEEVIRLDKPVECKSDVVGTVLFNPTLVKIHWDKPPSVQHEFWFPYWITINGKEKYGQFAPMIPEAALLELMQKAIERGFFSKDFLSRLQTTISRRLNS